MDYRENKNSPINRALNRLEDVRQSKKEKREEAKISGASQGVLSSAAIPLQQLENIFKNSQKTFGVIAQKFETKLKADPWDMLKKVAIGSLILGIVIGHRTRPFKAKVRK